MKRLLGIFAIAFLGLGCSQFRGFDPGDYDTEGIVGSACESDDDCDTGMYCRNGYCRSPQRE